MSDEGADRPSWRGDAPPLLGLLLIALAFFWPILIGEAFLWGDFAERVYPLRQYAAVELAAGRLPLWAPALFGGVPFLAMMDNAVLYPPSWLLVPFARDGTLSYLALEWLSLGHVWLLGVGMYLFSRTISVSRTGSLIAGTAWMLSGPIVHHAFHPAVIQTLTWLPFASAFLFRMFDTLSVRWAAAAAAAWGMAILAGHPQGFLYMAYAMGIAFVVHLVAAVRAPEGRSDALRLTGLMAFVLAGGLALAAAAFLPAYELASVSERTGAGLEGSGVSLPEFRQLVTFILPGFFGQMGPVRGDYWGPGATDFGFYWETYVYLGMLPVLLAGVGLVGSRGRASLFLGLLSAFCLLGIVGAVTPIPEVLWRVAPGFDLFRAHARLGIILGFSIAGLAGLGVDCMRFGTQESPTRSRVRRYLIGVSAVASVALVGSVIGAAPMSRWLAGGASTAELARASLLFHGLPAAALLVASLAVLWMWFAGRARSSLLALVAFGLIVSDLFAAGSGFNRSPVGPSEYFPETELTRALQARALGGGGRAVIEPSTPRILPMNAGVVFGFDAPLEGLASPLRLAATAPPTTLERTLDLLNVTHEVRRRPDRSGYTITDRAEPLPRAWVARRYVVAPDMTEVAEAMSGPAFDYRTMVTLDRQPELAITALDRTAAETAVVTFHDTDHVSVDVDMVAAGLLVLSEVYYPAWRATLNGGELEILRADGTLRAVALPEGRHTVDFRYRPTPLRVGLGVSLVALLVIVAIGSGWWWPGKQRVGTRPAVEA